MNSVDITGKKFGHLTAIRVNHISKGRHEHWLFRCDCGKEKVISKYSVVSGKQTSCGCQREKHGCCNERIYSIWHTMKQRCQNKNNTNYERYGWRGIKVCDEWESFEPFRDWAFSNGYNDTLTIDRIDNNGNYCPENCRWATRYEQDRNKRSSKFVQIGNETKCICDWAKHFCIGSNTVYDRIKRGWSIEKALTTPPDKRFANKVA